MKNLSSISKVMGAVYLAIGLSTSMRAAGPESLLIGPGDLIHIQVADTPEMDQHPRVTDAGDVPVTGVGEIKIAGMTPAQAATTIHDRLIAAHFMVHPEVLVSVEQYATQSVSVLGEVKSAGSYPIATTRSILDVLALAGGLTNLADRDLLIQHHADPSHPVHYTYANDSRAVSEQVMVNPGDIVVVPRAGIVYVLGDVNHPGGYVMSNNESKMTMLQAIALAGGLSKTAKQGDSARLIRKNDDGTYTDRHFSAGALEEGKTPDMQLRAGDVVYVPFSFGRNIAVLGAGGIAASATSAAVYALP